MMKIVLKFHERDLNFSHSVLVKIQEFLGKLKLYPILMGYISNFRVDNNDILENREKPYEIIYKMKPEAAIITNNSPYSEVRPVVDNKDETEIPCSTTRGWVMVDRPGISGLSRPDKNQ
jgi:hypothetical protein